MYRRRLIYALGPLRFETTLRVVMKRRFRIFHSSYSCIRKRYRRCRIGTVTAGYTDSLPARSLIQWHHFPWQFFQLGTPFPEVQQRLYASALILLIIVLTLSIVSRYLSRKFTKNIIRWYIWKKLSLFRMRRIKRGVAKLLESLLKTTRMALHTWTPGKASVSLFEKSY